MNTLEEKYSKNYNESKRLYNLGRKKESLAYFKIALETLYQLAKETYNSDKKEKYLTLAEKIRPDYDALKDEVENENKKIVVDEVKPKTSKTTTKKEENNSSSNSESEIETVFNGIDVKRFISLESNEKVTFKDVKGMDDSINTIKLEFSNVDKVLKFKEHHKIKNKNFLLLYGVPGTGKTFFAKAISNEMNCNFVNVICPQLKGKYHGESENNIIAVFEYCKQFPRCILFLDEFESIGMDRNSKQISEVGASTVITLLQLIDGFNSNKNILVIAATNYPEKIDSALISRANLSIEVPLATKEVIKDILMQQISDEEAKDINFDYLAEQLVGYSNRDIINLISKAKDIALRDFIKASELDPNLEPEEFPLTQDHILKAIKLKPSSVSKEEIERIANFSKKFKTFNR